jgi:hypothetical protein
VVGTNLALRPLVHRLDARLVARGRATGRYSVTLLCAEAAAPRLRPLLLAAVRGAGLLVDSVQSAPDPGEGQVRLTLRAEGSSRAEAIEAAVAELSRDPGVRGSSWTEERVAPDS